MEEEIATCSSILAWEIPWTEKPGGVQFMGLQESDTTESACAYMHAHTHTHTQQVYHAGCSMSAHVGELHAIFKREN